MNRQPGLVVAGAVMLIALLIRSTAVSAEALHGKHAASGIDLICLTEQPAIIEGQNATLRAWASTSDGRPVKAPLHFHWDVDAGRIADQGAMTQWDLSSVKVRPPGEVRKVTATVRTAAPGRSPASCTVQVLIGKKSATALTRGLEEWPSLISARHYLLRGEPEAPDYGLYSYLLFSAPPKDAEERQRYLKTIDACLLVLQDVDVYLSRHVRPRSLNITYIPVMTIPSHGKSRADWAVNVLNAYDYAEAQILLNNVRQDHEGGPYLVSVLTPLSQSDTQVHLWEDLTGVVPSLAWDWMRNFTYLAAQQRSWSQVSLRHFALTLRNLIAVAGKVAPMTAAALQQAIQYVSDVQPRRVVR